MTKILELPTIEDTKRLAAEIAALSKVGDVITLRGELGAGKTEFARAFIQACGDKNMEVPSPTFTMVQTYDLPRFTLHHFDLYRLTAAEDVFELGLEEALAEGVTIIEWPEIIAGIALANRLDLHLSFKPQTQLRQVEITPDASWQSRLSI